MSILIDFENEDDYFEFLNRIYQNYKNHKKTLNEEIIIKSINSDYSLEKLELDELEYPDSDSNYDPNEVLKIQDFIYTRFVHILSADGDEVLVITLNNNEIKESNYSLRINIGKHDNMDLKYKHSITKYLYKQISNSCKHCECYHDLCYNIGYPHDEERIKHKYKNLNSKYLDLFLAEFLFRNYALLDDDIVQLFGYKTKQEFYTNSHLLELFEERKVEYKNELQNVEFYTKNPEFTTNLDLIKECIPVFEDFNRHKKYYDVLKKLVDEYITPVSSTKSARKLVN